MYLHLFFKNEGDQLTLTCDVTAGDPVPTNFTWTLPSGTTQDGANLVIGMIYLWLIWLKKPVF